MLNRRARLRFFSRKKPTHQKAAWWVHAIVQWHSQCVGWSGFLDGFDCIDGWQPKGSGKCIPIEASGGSGLKFLLVCPRSQLVDEGFGSAVDMALQSSFALFLGSSAFSIFDSAFHGQWHICRVRRQAPCSGKCACLGNHTRKISTVEVVTTLGLLAGSKMVLDRDCAMQK